MADRTDPHAAYAATVILACFVLGGCRNAPSLNAANAGYPTDQIATVADAATEFGPLLVNETIRQEVALVAVDSATEVAPAQFVELVTASPESLERSSAQAEPIVGEMNLDQLVSQAISVHPEIVRLRATTREAWARVPQVRSLPDPMARGSVYGEPMMMADGETRGTFMISQTLPYLKRLDARGQQASFEAMMNQQAVRAAEQRIAADVREAIYRLYLIDQLLQINDANEQLIGSLVTVASAQVEVGRATAGDVILGTLELSRIEEERLQLRQQLASRKAILNRLLNRPADSPVMVPSEIEDVDFDLSLDTLRGIAAEQQPEIMMARLRTQATAWGIQIAKLERVPDLTLSYDHMFMRMNPGMNGGDPWQIAAGVNIPLWHQKYDAIRQEASQRHLAANAGIEEIVRANEAMVLDFREQAIAADQTARLYQDTILPQIRQGLDADQRAYGQGAVQFERVIGNARNLLTARSAYHRSLTDKAIALARLEQAIGTPLPTIDATEKPDSPLPSPSRDD